MATNQWQEGDKQLDAAGAVRFVATEKRRGRSVGLVTGCFDVLHVGHVDLLRFARSHVDCLVVGVDNDTSVRLSKGPTRPRVPHRDRTRLLSELSVVDAAFVVPYVARFGPDAASCYASLVNDLMPNIVVTHAQKDAWADCRKRLLKPLGIPVLLFQTVCRRSSSRILDVREDGSY